MARTLLVYPPYHEPGIVPVAMVRATVALRRDGHEVACLDANQALWADWLAADFLAGKLARMQAERRRQEAAGVLPDGHAAWRYYRALRATVGAERLLAQLDRAQAVLAAAAGSQADRAWAKRIIANLLDIALWPVPGVARLNDLTLAASSESSADVLNTATGGDEVNPFRRFWSGWIEREITTMPDTLILWLEADQQLIPAVTLAARLKAGAYRPRIIAAGSFVRFLRDLPGQWWSGLFDTLEPTRQDSDGAGTDLAAELKGLAAQRRAPWLSPPVVALDPPGDDPANLAASMIAVSAAFADTIVHLPTPRTVPALLDLAKAGTRAPRWGAVVKFGFALDRPAAAALRAAGCVCLHFEIKGFSGYAAAETAALATMLDSLRSARAAGLATLASLVYGYPTDTAAAFARFISAMKPHRDEVDRWVRFKVFRLTRNNLAWDQPEAHGILSRADPPAGLDLARHVPFVTARGEHSQGFHAAASAALAEFRRADDFPVDPMLDDDVCAAANPEHALPSGDLIASIREGDLDTTPFPYAALEKAFGGYVPGPGRPVPAVSLAAGPAERLARTADGSRVVAISDGLMKLVRLCEESATADQLAARLAATTRGATRGDAAALMGRLQALGLIRMGRHADALT